MDLFATEQRALAAMNNLFISARRTGRTSLLVDNVRDGDTVVFTNEREAKRVAEMVKARGKTIKTLVASPTYLHRLMQGPPARERFVFDHSWLEEAYTNAIHETALALDSISRHMSARESEQEDEETTQAWDDDKKIL